MGLTLSPMEQLVQNLRYELRRETAVLARINRDDGYCDRYIAQNKKINDLWDTLDKARMDMKK